MTKVKICGLRRREDIEMVNAYLPDACGFILSQPYRRYVPKEQLRWLKPLVDPRIRVFGVFVNEPAETVIQFVQEGLIDGVQLHGEEDETYIHTLRKACPDLYIMKAFTVKTEADIEKAKASPADMVLLDSGKGSGRTFSWQLLKNFNREYVLAGGLNPDNIEEALSTLRPYGADTSSGVETDGVKDAGKIKNFIHAVRKGDTEYAE